MPSIFNNLACAIEKNQERLRNGEMVTILFDDGIANVVNEIENGIPKIKTFIEPIEQRVVGSIQQYRFR